MINSPESKFEEHCFNNSIRIFLIESCAVLVKPTMTSSLYSQTDVNISKMKKDILKIKTLFFYKDRKRFLRVSTVIEIQRE